MEIWKDIEGWEGIYQISNCGRLKSFKKLKTGKILSNTNKTGWYLGVILEAKGKINQSCKIHILVAKYFVPNPDGKPDVNHKDTNKQNNHDWNLEWVTKSENMEHISKEKPEFLAGMNTYNWNRLKEILQVSTSGEIVERFVNGRLASEKTGICERNIYQVATRTPWKPGKVRRQAGGFIWRYADEFQTDSVEQQRECVCAGA